MTPAPDQTSPPPPPSAPPPRTGTYVAIAALLLLGTALFATGTIAKVRQPTDAPPARVLGLPAWQIAAAGFLCTLTGGLWLRRLV